MARLNLQPGNLVREIASYLVRENELLKAVSYLRDNTIEMCLSRGCCSKKLIDVFSLLSLGLFAEFRLVLQYELDLMLNILAAHVRSILSCCPGPINRKLFNDLAMPPSPNTRYGSRATVIAHPLH